MSARTTLPCPRCGYDLTGIAASWKETCPLSGVCSECGLAFEWVDVYRPERNRVRGFHEHAHTFREWVWWAASTLWWALRPRVFWSRVTVFVPLRPWRTLAWLAVGIVPMYLLG